jgi:hydrogenase maturation protease
VSVQPRPGQSAVPPVLVIGVGNILLSDEGIGVHVIRTLSQRRAPRHIEFVDGGTGGLALLDVMRHRRRVVIVDAIAAKGPPGAVFRWCPDGPEETRAWFRSAHMGGILEVLRVGKLLFELPSLVCIGIVPMDTVTPSVRLSRELRRRLPTISQLVLREALSKNTKQRD